MRQHARRQKRRLARRDHRNAHPLARRIHSRIGKAPGDHSVEPAPLGLDAPLDHPLGQFDLFHAAFDRGGTRSLAGEIGHVVEFDAGARMPFQVIEPFIGAQKADTHGEGPICEDRSRRAGRRRWC